MIVEGFFKIIFGLVDLLLSLIPDFSFDFELPDVSSFQEMLGLANYFFPIESCVAAIGVLIVVQNAQFILKIFNYIIKKIPLIG